MKSGKGIASRMHTRRIGPVEAITGPLRPGTLNLVLDRRFDWGAAHHAVQVPDARDWSNLDGAWYESTARIYPVSVNGLRAWVMHLDRSRASKRLVEIVAAVRLRDVLEDPVTVAHA
jgi:CTP-dependent riboflavin kinase